MSRSKNRPTLDDVALKAHVAKSTASQVLRGLGRFDESTRIRVQEAAAELGYRPNAAARYLSADQRMPMVALVFSALPGGSTPPQMFWTQAVNEFTHELLRNSVASLVVPSISNLALSTLPLEALVLITANESDLDSDEIRNLKIPLMVGGIQLRPGLEADYPFVDAWIISDNYNITATALQHLQDQGAKKPGLLFADVPMAWRRDFRIGGEEWFAEHDIPATVYETNDLRSAAAAALDDGCDAFVVLGSDHRPDLDSVLDEIRSRGYRIPEDVMVAFLSHAARTEFLDPPVTVIYRESVTVGRGVAQMVVKAINSGQFESYNLETTLIQRPSTTRKPA